MMACQQLDPVFILALLVGIPWVALIFTGLIYGLLASKKPEPQG